MLMLNNLIGFGGASITSIAQQASATSTASTITWPAVAAGDIAVLFDYAQSGSTPSSVTPDGFTNMCNSSDADERAMTSFKLCNGSESGSLTGMNGATTNRKAMVTFRCAPGAGYAAHAGNTSGGFTNNDPGNITVTSGSGRTPLIVVACYRSTGAVNPRTFTVGGSAAKDGEVSFHTNTFYIAWKFYLSEPSDVVIDMDDEGDSNCQQGAYIYLA
jgi:hypothetical protein